ncbi:hypothetical protein HPP92_028614 [Vanilla planifolia]|uniref:Uncharacterized protein n=1 Tax=Vanilla planifolia TaxID=51239 RepID=A0A835PAA6_VANPL|nr:hypothetical protein HPP92_028614 [Vanilla planifolia]KAG0446935.1 hypothetical protein HPP92_028608 [Vanilla planifolia]
MAVKRIRRWKNPVGGKNLATSAAMGRSEKKRRRLKEGRGGQEMDIVTCLCTDRTLREDCRWAGGGSGGGGKLPVALCRSFLAYKQETVKYCSQPAPSILKLL